MKTPQFEVPNEMRDFAAKSVEQTRRAFDGFLGAAHEATQRMEGSSLAMQGSAKAMTTQVMEFAEQNVKAALDLADQLVKAKGLDEVIRIQNAFMTQQMTNMQAQFKAMGEAVKDAAASQTPKSK
jgi:phasin